MALFLYSKWLELPLPTRIKIAQAFGIAKVRSTHVSNDRIVDDGYTIADIERALSVESIQGFLDVEETETELLFAMLVDQVEGRRSTPKLSTITREEAKAESERYEDRTGLKAPNPVAEKPKRGRKPKAKTE